MTNITLILEHPKVLGKDIHIFVFNHAFIAHHNSLREKIFHLYFKPQN